MQNLSLDHLMMVDQASFRPDQGAFETGKTEGAAAAAAAADDAAWAVTSAAGLAADAVADSEPVES